METGTQNKDDIDYQWLPKGSIPGTPSEWFKSAQGMWACDRVTRKVQSVQVSMKGPPLYCALQVGCQAASCKVYVNCTPHNRKMHTLW